jgi:hypothetical protein
MMHVDVSLTRQQAQALDLAVELAQDVLRTAGVREADELKGAHRKLERAIERAEVAEAAIGGGA